MAASMADFILLLSLLLWESEYQTQGIFYTKTLYNLTPYPNFLSIPILVVQARNCLEVASSTIRITRRKQFAVSKRISRLTSKKEH